MTSAMRPAAATGETIKKEKPDVSMMNASLVPDEEDESQSPEAQMPACSPAPAAFPAPIEQPIEGAFCTRSTFFVNADCTSSADIDQGQKRVARMFVECLEPLITVHPMPIILIHGDWHTGQIWTTKPDGAPGWASYFNYQGYRVFVVDMPTCGRSNVLVNGRSYMKEQSAVLEPSLVERDMTAPGKQSIQAWQTARFHTQWPGTGQPGDGIFDNYCSSIVPVFLRKTERQMLGQKALSELLEGTGRAILIGEGTGATMAWLAADIKPDLVACVVAVEPAGPPAGTACHIGPDGIRQYTTHVRFDPNIRPFGVSDIPLTYGPPVGEKGPTSAPGLDKHKPTLDLMPMAFHNGVGTAIVQRCFETNDSIKGKKYGKKKATVAQPQHLINLKKMPHSIWTGEASSHSMFDWATVEFLKQAGVSAYHVCLENYGMRGNGRLLFLERNSDLIANLMAAWIDDHAKLEEVKPQGA
ncbi:hypothetical protein HIM_02173 [Hirsutella minnesotensis 3608]|nr:hypothetical protein HIM_02173 [Hirsutella minnesotensis 3608]